MIQESPIRLAMLAMATRQRNLGRIGAQVKSSVTRNVGTRTINDWNAHLSLKTYTRLVKDGVMSAKQEQEVAV